HQWSEGVERSLRTNLELPVYVLLDQVHRNVTWSFDDHLAIKIPRDLGQLAQRIQLRKLSFIISIRYRTRPQAVSQTKGHVVSPHDLANLSEVGVEKTLLVMSQTPLCHNRSAA